MSVAGKKQMMRAAALILACVLVVLAPIAARPQTQTPAQAPAPVAPAGSSAPAYSSATNPQDATPRDTSAPPETSAPADNGKTKKEKKDKNDTPAEIASWLLVDVVGGSDKVPVAEASVYVKFTEVHKVGRDKKLEFDLKTNQEGEARAPDIPQGKVLIQVVAQGWKSFGQYYDVEQDQQTIHIALERPPRWY